MKESTANLIRVVLVIGTTFFFGFINLIGIFNKPSQFRRAITNNYSSTLLSLIGGFIIGALIGLTMWTIVYIILIASGKEVKYWAISFKRDNK